MLWHIVLLRWSDTATAEQKQQAEAGLRALPTEIPEIRALRCGQDAGLAAGNHDFAAVFEFATEQDWQTYQDSAAHQDLIARSLKPILASRATSQFHVD